MKKEYFENILKRLEIEYNEVEVVKNNNTVMKGYTLGSAEIRPTVYLDMIEGFDDEVEVVKFLEGINMKTKNIENIFVKERFENNVIMCVRNKEWNNLDTNTFTFDIPDFEDLEGYYRLRLSKEDCISLGIIHTETDDGESTCVVNHGTMAALGIDENWLKIQGEKTMLSEMRIKGMTETLIEMMTETETSLPFLEEDIEYYKENEVMYVLSNKSRIRGAGVIASNLCMEKIKEFAKKMEMKKYAILPSSIHEVLLVKLEEEEINCSIENLDNMVKEVNEEKVDIKERLSNHAYIFES